MRCCPHAPLASPSLPCLRIVLGLAGDVEERYVEMEEGRLVATPEKMRPLIDENTIGARPSGGGGRQQAGAAGCGRGAGPCSGAAACRACCVWQARTANAPPTWGAALLCLPCCAGCRFTALAPPAPSQRTHMQAWRRCLVPPTTGSLRMWLPSMPCSRVRPAAAVAGLAWRPKQALLWVAASLRHASIAHVQSSSLVRLLVAYLYHS